MKFEWLEYYDLAKELANTNSVNSGNSVNNPILRISEAKLRSSISRAYYGAFCLARNYLRDVLCDPRLSKARSSDINEHQYVAKEFINNQGKNKKMIDIGKDLNLLREFRNRADYEDIYSNLGKDAKLTLKLAENIITKINELNK